MLSVEFGNRTDVLTSTIPADGTTTAVGLAKLYAALLGDIEGVQLLDEDRRELITQSAVSDDEVIGFPQKRSLGFTVGIPMSPVGSPTLFGWAGSCGTATYADSATGLTLAVNNNRCHYGRFDAFGAIARAVTRAMAGSERSRGVRSRQQPTALSPGGLPGRTALTTVSKGPGTRPATRTRPVAFRSAAVQRRRGMGVSASGSEWTSTVPECTGRGGSDSRSASTGQAVWDSLSRSIGYSCTGRGIMNGTRAPPVRRAAHTNGS